MKTIFVSATLLLLSFSSYSQFNDNFVTSKDDTVLIKYLVFSKLSNISPNFNVFLENNKLTINPNNNTAIQRGVGIISLFKINKIVNMNNVFFSYIKITNRISCLFAVDFTNFNTYFLRYENRQNIIYWKDLYRLFEDQKYFFNKLDYNNRLSLYLQLTLPKYLGATLHSSQDSLTYLFPISDFRESDSIKFMERFNTNLSEINNIKENEIVIYNMVHDYFYICYVKERKFMHFNFYTTLDSKKGKVKMSQNWFILGPEGIGSIKIDQGNRQYTKRVGNIKD